MAFNLKQHIMLSTSQTMLKRQKLIFFLFVY
uniref:Uncharacterized protein n=1 Tax=Arundo donax TaxID=35708 RepID=A0A0A9CLI3_ARUDO